MSNSKSKMIVFASILGAILATGLLALNPSPMIKNASAQMYGDQYGYDNHQKKSSHTDIQKIKCANSNINVNGIDITQIPQDNTALGAANEATGPEAANTQNSNNGLADRINFDRNLVNTCFNINNNEQVKASPPSQNQILAENLYIVAGEGDTDETIAEDIATCDPGDIAISGGILTGFAGSGIQIITTRPDVASVPPPPGFAFDSWQGSVVAVEAGDSVGVRAIAQCFDNPPGHTP
jgi:hypothetical protein